MDYFGNQPVRSISKWPNHCQVCLHSIQDAHELIQHRVQYMGRIQRHDLHPIHQGEHVDRSPNT